MSISAHQGHVLFGSGSYANADRVVDTAASRGLLLNNTIWACEQASQVRVKKMVATQGDEMRRAADRGIVADDWHPIYKTRFDCHMHPDGGAYTFRVRLAGRSTAGNACSFRLVISHPTYAAADVLYDPALGHVREFTSSSTTHAWLTPTGGAKVFFRVPPALVAAAVRVQPTRTSTTGSATSTAVCGLSCQVWGATANVASYPAVSGVIVEEFIGI